MDPLGPDPYKALGVSRDCDQTVIKATYRKLVLKCHPDKVMDESLKKQKEEEFHKIQTAWELIGDEESRAKYDAKVTQQRLAREEFARRGGATSAGVSQHYEVRTQAPAGATSYRTTTTTTKPRYEEHKPTSRSYEDRHYDDRSRKYDTYDAYPKHSSSRSPRDKEPTIKVPRVPADRTRSDYKKSRDKEERKERERRFVSISSDDDEYQRFESGYKGRSDEHLRRKEDDEARRVAAEARRKAEDRRSFEDTTHDRHRKVINQENNAIHYMQNTGLNGERPSPTRATSSREVRQDYYDSSRSRRDRSDNVRRSSARPSKDRPSSSGRDRERRGPQIVEWEADDRKMPSFKHSSSSPADLHVPRMPQRSYTESSREHRRTDSSPSPPVRRSETMPSVPHTSSSRRKDATAPRTSGLRESTAQQSTSPGSYPTVPPPTSTATYYYPTPGGGVRLSPEDIGVANGHRTVLVEPDRRHRSPSPLSRPPMGANRPVEPTAAYATAAPKISLATPPLGRSATFNVSTGRASEDRGRRLYGEQESDYTRRQDARGRTSFAPEQVSYTRKIGPEDINWSPSRGRDKPSFSRTATYVY